MYLSLLSKRANDKQFLRPNIILEQNRIPTDLWKVRFTPVQKSLKIDLREMIYHGGV